MLPGLSGVSLIVRKLGAGVNPPVGLTTDSRAGRRRRPLGAPVSCPPQPPPGRSSLVTMGLRRDEWAKSSTVYIARKMSPRLLEPRVNQDEIRGELASHLAGGPRPPAEGRE